MNHGNRSRTVRFPARNQRKILVPFSKCQFLRFERGPIIRRTTSYSVTHISPIVLASPVFSTRLYVKFRAPSILRKSTIADAASMLCLVKTVLTPCDSIGKQYRYALYGFVK